MLTPSVIRVQSPTAGEPVEMCSRLRALRRVPLNAAVEAVLWPLILGLFAAGYWLQSQVHLNHDVGWILHSAGWLLEGKRFGSDIVDANPPLIWFFSLPAAGLAKTGWFSEAVAIRLYVFAVCFTALVLSHRVLRPLRQQGRPVEAAALLVGAAFAITLISAGSFAQREFIAFALGLPYCLLTAARIGFSESVPRSIAISAGVLAGIAFGFKPWLLAVPFALEILYVIERRSLRELFRAETVALTASLIAYGFLILAITPDYLSAAIPFARAVYWAYDQQDALKLWPSLSDALQPLWIVALMFALARSFPVHARALIAVLAGFALNYWLQRKGFVYHLYPVVATVIVLLVYGCACVCRTLLTGGYTARVWMSALATCVLVLLTWNQLSDRYWQTRIWLKQYNVETGEVGRIRQALIDRVNGLAPAQGGHVYAFSTHPFPAFPTLNYVHAEWSSALPCQFAIPAIVRRKEVSDERLQSELTRAESYQRETVLKDFMTHRPDVVLIAPAVPRLGLGFRRFDDIAFYTSDPRFAAIWRVYREVEGINGVRIFVRSE
jgi:hypothetical protein